MTLSDSDKLITLLLCDIHQALVEKPKSGLDPKLIESAIFDGSLWALKDKYSAALAAKEPSEAVVHETTDIMWMWNILEDEFERLGPDEQKNVRDALPPHLADVKFMGFDAQNEFDYYRVATFKVKELGQFDRFEGRDLNTHFQILRRCQRMYQVFDPLIREKPDHPFGAERLVTVLIAADEREPSARKSREAGAGKEV